MHTNFSFKVKHYKCFGDEPQGFVKVMPINIIIGKNNSGKSSLLDIIPFIIAPTTVSLGNDKTEVIITDLLSEDTIRRNFPEHKIGGALSSYRDHFDYGKRFINTEISYRLLGKERIFLGTEVPIEYFEIKSDFEGIIRTLKNPFSAKSFSYITAERNILPEHESHDIEIKPNGEGVTSLLNTIINSVDYDSRLVQQKLLTELVKIIRPDIDIFNLITQRYSNGVWEFFLETPNETRIALSKMGSGIKTILQVLTNLIILPIIKKVRLDNCVFAFEELENNLHPAMQRRLFEYLKAFALEWNTTLFITTHSNIVIDIFGDDEDSQIVHIKKENGSTVVRSVDTYEGNKQILKDLDVKASDILQSNGIIWVEGPSDRHYLNKWISLIEPNLKEGIHYSILLYGGRVLSNFCFDYGWLERELIPLLKINSNAYVVMDKDGKRESDQLNATKRRIQTEIGDKCCWVTKGREIENYLTANTLEKWLGEKHKLNVKVSIDPYEKIETSLANSGDQIELKYNESKNAFSREIVEFITVDDLSVLDLKEKITSLVSLIKEWNSK